MDERSSGKFAEQFDLVKCPLGNFRKRIFLHHRGFDKRLNHQKQKASKFGEFVNNVIESSKSIFST